MSLQRPHSLSRRVAALIAGEWDPGGGANYRAAPPPPHVRRFRIRAEMALRDGQDGRMLFTSVQWRSWGVLRGPDSVIKRLSVGKLRLIKRDGERGAGMDF